MKIVKFNNGTYGIRRFSVWGWEFYVHEIRHWCSVSRKRDYQMSENEAKSVFTILKNGGYEDDIGTPVIED